MNTLFSAPCHDIKPRSASGLAVEGHRAHLSAVRLAAVVPEAADSVPIGGNFPSPRDPINPGLFQHKQSLRSETHSISPKSYMAASCVVSIVCDFFTPDFRQHNDTRLRLGKARVSKRGVYTERSARQAEKWNRLSVCSFNIQKEKLYKYIVKI